MNIRTLLSQWQYDPISSLLTVIVIPILIYIAAIVKRPLFAGIKYITLGVLYAVSASLSKAAAASLSLRRYVSIQLSGSNRHLYVPALKDVHLDVDTIFVPLTLERAGTQTTYDHTNFLNAGNRILVIGDPGSGKSSIARRVFRDACRSAQSIPRKSHFPILLELRNIPFPNRGAGDVLGKWLFEYVRAQATKDEVYEINACFETYLRTNGILLLLDGLDEVSSRNYERAATAITQFSQTLQRHGPNNIIVLTMRIQFFQQIRAQFTNEFPIVFSIKRFTPTDIYEFLWRWDFPSAIKIREVTRIYTDLTDRPTLREMCSNPLVLSMYVAQDQASGHPIAPESRTEFYSRVVEELLIRRRAVQVGAPEGQAVIREQREKILGEIAFEHLTDADQPANLLSWDRSVAITQKVTGLAREEAEKYLRTMTVATGLITEERAGEVLRFIHLTFCEYLGAFEAVQGRPTGWDELIQRHREFRANVSLRTRLVEVLPFACAL